MQSCVLIVLDSKLMGIITWDFEFSGLTKLDASASNFLHRVYCLQMRPVMTIDHSYQFFCPGTVPCHIWETHACGIRLPKMD